MSAEGVSRRMSAQGVSAYGVCVQRGFFLGGVCLEEGIEMEAIFCQIKVC